MVGDGENDDLRRFSAIDHMKRKAFESPFAEVGTVDARIKIRRGAVKAVIHRNRVCAAARASSADTVSACPLSISAVRRAASACHACATSSSL